MGIDDRVFCVQVYVRQDQIEAMEVLARKREDSMSKLYREAIDAFLAAANHKDDEATTLPAPKAGR